MLIRKVVRLVVIGTILGLVVAAVATFKFRSLFAKRRSLEVPIREGGNVKISTETPVDVIMNSRLETLHERCTEIKMEARGKPRFLYSQQQKAVACKAAKTGSSFLGTVFIAIESSKEADDTFHIDRNQVHYRVRTIDASKLELINPEKTVIVSRNPFQRLFSVYIDKVYLLGSIGRQVENFVHKHTTKYHNFCGYNVTFQNFLDMILSGRNNEHWAPVSKLCIPCNIKYNIVCKTETLTRDTEYILGRFNLSGTRRESIKSMFHIKGLRPTVYSLVAAYMSDYKTYKSDCPNISLMIKKIWKVFKIQGYLHDSVPFPKQLFDKLKNQNVENITNVVFNGIQSRPMSAGEKFRQRKKYIVDGYRQIKQSTLQNLQRLYRQDFILFGYDPKPPLF